MSTRITSVEKLALLVELSNAFSALTDLESLLADIMSKTQAVFQSENCALFLLDEARQELYVPVTSDVSPTVENRFQHLRFPADQGIAGWVVQHGQSIYVPDVRRDERFTGHVDESTGAATRELLYAPLRTRSGLIGVIGLRNKRHGNFTEDDLAFLEALAGSIAVTVENARLYEQLRHSEAQLKGEVAILHRERANRLHYNDIIGTGRAIRKVFTLMESAITTPINVLLEGETGTGKELIARAIHYHSPRKGRPFVAVNCGALPDMLLESELFGHAKGAFTGAATDKQGLFEVAHGGTIFLDEIGETTPAMQVKLLRALQEGEIRRVGETRTRQVDARVIATTNRQLQQEVLQQRFREDLYYRLSTFPITIPPLRERREDIPLLVTHFLQKISSRLGKPIPGVTQETLDILSRYTWPGNVRELKNVLERAVALAPAGLPIPPDFLPEDLLTRGGFQMALPLAGSTLHQARQAFERTYVAEVLRQHAGNATHAARVLGISRQMLQRKIKQYDLRHEKSAVSTGPA